VDEFKKILKEACFDMKIIIVMGFGPESILRYFLFFSHCLTLEERAV